jgi:hypothetical protein
MASAYLQRSTGTPTSQTQFTVSAWVKRSGLDSSNNMDIFCIYSDNSNRMHLRFQGDDIDVINYGGSAQARLTTDRKFRDTNAWYHIVWRVDTTLATADDRVRLYINGLQETSFSTRTNPSQNFNFGTNWSTTRIGTGNTTTYFDGQFAHFHYADGQSYAPTVFGETDATTGIWKPKTSPTVTYGNQGFFLKFDNSANMGLDSSGQTNNFTTNGTIIQNKDTPSNVFATMNPIDSYWMAATYSNGNNKVVTQGSHRTSMAATLGASSGKYYWEVKVDENTGLIMIGIDTKGASTCSTFSSGQCLEYTGQRTYGWGYDSSNGQIYNNDSSASYGNTYTVNDIIGIALDLDNNKLYFSKNGTWQNSGVPTSGSTGTGAVSITAPSSTDTGVYFPACSDTSSSASVTYSMNFGNGYFGTTAVTSAQNPDDGIGIFEYDVPAGYRALCTKSLNAQEYS